MALDTCSIAAAKAPNTIRAYQSDWRHFEEWARERAKPVLPAAPETLIAYLTDLAQVAKVSTLERRIATISQAHQMAGCESPTRAILLVGFAGGFRRSELVGIDVEDLEFKRAGLVVTLKRSKTDQEGAGWKVGIPYGSNEAR